MVEFSDANIEFYPVPFQDKIEVKGFEKAKISIFDTNGKMVFDNNFVKEANILTEKFSSGIYMIQIENEGKIMTKKVVKN